MPSVGGADNIQSARDYVAENIATTQRAGKENFLQKQADQPQHLKYAEPVVSDQIEKRLTKDATIAGQTKAIRESFGVDQTVKPWNPLDYVEKGGFELIDSGITNSIKIGDDTGRADANGFRPTGSNDVLAAWEQANASETRRVVSDLSKSPDELRQETLARHWGVDVEA